MKFKSTVILITLLALTLCILGGCSNNTSTNPDKEAFAEYVAFNSLERLEKDGVNYKKEYYAIEDGKQVLIFTVYWDSGKLYAEYDERTTFSYDGNLAFYRFQSDGETSYTSLLLGSEGIDKLVVDDALLIPEEETLIETISDEQFIAVTEISAKEYVVSEMEGYVGDEIEYEEGMRIRYSYIFDEDTKELLQIDSTLLLPDDSTRDLGAIKYSYNVEFQDPFEREENKEYVAAAKDQTLSRTIKVTYGPGTDDEQTMEYTIPKEYPFYIFTDNYVSEIYLDKDCTELFDVSGDAGEDLELFVPLD